jgi:hypothetical protein
MNMSKIIKENAIFIVFLIIVGLSGLIIINQINVIMQYHYREPQVGGLNIQFENGTSESEVKATLENYKMTVNYTIDYDSDTMLKRDYITVDQGKRLAIMNELKKDEAWPSYTEVKKGNYSIIMLPEEFIPDEQFLTMLEENNLQLKKSMFCYIHLGDGSPNWISEKSAIEIKNEIEINERVLTVSFDHYE